MLIHPDFHFWQRMLRFHVYYKRILNIYYVSFLLRLSILWFLTLWLDLKVIKIEFHLCTLQVLTTYHIKQIVRKNARNLRHGATGQCRPCKITQYHEITIPIWSARFIHTEHMAVRSLQKYSLDNIKLYTSTRCTISWPCVECMYIRSCVTLTCICTGQLWPCSHVLHDG